MNVDFASKARTLSVLKSRIKSAKIAPMVYFSIKQWRSNPKGWCDQITSLLGENVYIVRSSCQNEDSNAESRAGAYLTIKNVGTSKLKEAIDKVIDSYGVCSDTSEVLVQPMLCNVKMSGVGFTHDPTTCSPYQMIGWTDGPDTSRVTGGLDGNTFIRAAKCSDNLPEGLQKVFQLLEELLSLVNGEPLDFEFAITDGHSFGNGNTLWLLQVRPLLMNGSVETRITQAKRLEEIYMHVSEGMKPSPGLFGNTTIYGVMPDWNPAEIIGIRPKPLALSLYRELVTDLIWARQRDHYGYRNLQGWPLIKEFHGMPYVDVRLVFNSFVPAALDTELAERLVEYYLDKLKCTPSLHDKVEFEIVLSCITLDSDEIDTKLSDAGFDKNEKEIIKDHLSTLTRNVICPNTGFWLDDIEKFRTLNRQREEIHRSKLNKIGKIYRLLEDAKHYGTLPFAGLARTAFVAIQILKSLVSSGILTPEDYDAYIKSITTVTGSLSSDLKGLGRSEFLAKYGHLRPGTYDILSPRYDEEPEKYFDWSQGAMESVEVTRFLPTKKQKGAIDRLLKSSKLSVGREELFYFIENSIKWRELAKFYFTKNLSDLLLLIGSFAEELGISKHKVSHARIDVFKSMYSSSADNEEVLKKSIEHGESCYRETTRLLLPPIILDKENIWSFHLPKSVPNFITQKRVISSVVGYDDKELISGAIVCIPNADPGFDWLFTYPIAGIITAWGGTNSHMAIRAGELGIPSVLGAGEVLYHQWSLARKILIDCANRRVEVIN